MVGAISEFAEMVHGMTIMGHAEVIMVTAVEVMLAIMALNVLKGYRCLQTLER